MFLPTITIYVFIYKLTSLVIIDSLRIRVMRLNVRGEEGGKKKRKKNSKIDKT